MKITRAWIESRKTVIFGTGKIQKDFQYMFDWITCQYYVSRKQTDADKDIFSPQRLADEDPEELLVIVCDEDREAAKAVLTELKLEYGRQFFWVDDLLFLLDSMDEGYINTKQVYIWGCGETQANLERELGKNEYHFPIVGYIDNDSKKWGGEWCNRPVFSPAELKKAENAYVIVASIYYDAIKTQLEEMGKQEGTDFQSYFLFMVRPSLLLKKTMYEKPLDVPKCNIPFQRLSYTCFGHYPCCVGWVDYPIGMPALDTCQESWNSVIMKLYRLSVENRTYSFCKKGVCKLLPRIPRILEEEKIGDYRTQVEEYPRLLVCGLDDSCNLHCESCRGKVRFAQGELLQERKKYAQKLIDSSWLEKADELFLSIDGEVFASEVDRMVLFGENVSRSSVHVLTNGNLLDERNWNRLESTYSNIWISISIDAASEHTYSLLRRGGNWKKLQNNLAMLSQKRMEGRLQCLDIRMVVQKKNYMEMESFAQMGLKYHCDKVIFSKINNFGTYTDEEYEKISMISRLGVLKEDMKRILEKPIFNEKFIDLSDFALYREAREG